VADGEAPTAVEDAVAAHQDEIAELRKEIEGDAMLYHAINSHALLIRDVLAATFSDDGAATIYAAARKPE